MDVGAQGIDWADLVKFPGSFRFAVPS